MELPQEPPSKPSKKSKSPTWNHKLGLAGGMFIGVYYGTTLESWLVFFAMFVFGYIFVILGIRVPRGIADAAKRIDEEYNKSDLHEHK